MFDQKFERECYAWIDEAVAGMTHEIERLTPVEYSEKVRYLPAHVTPFPGYMNFSVNPFMREVINCFDIFDDAREVNLQKGVQLTYTTVLESVLLYFMGHVKTAPCMFITADKGIAEVRIENNIIPMIQQSGLEHIIQSSDSSNTRKTGLTAKHIQWKGGGYLLPFGANSQNKMRSFSIQCMLKDEIDGWQDTIGKSGDPDELTDNRCAAFWERRKIFRGSTPLITETSKINSRFLEGDQRYYHVCCKSCNFPQVLKFQGVNKKTGLEFGLKWDTDDGIIVKESVRYICENCGHAHFEHDKTYLFAEENGAKWIPTAKPKERGIYSYQLSALYSPARMQPWSRMALNWVAAWNVEENMPRDNAKLQVFYNEQLGVPYAITGDRLTRRTVSALRRREYRCGEVPNMHAETYAGGKIIGLTMAVDVHKHNLAVAVMGWAPAQRAYVIDYWRFEGDGLDIECPETWGEVRKLIEQKEYIADDGRRYRIAVTLIDASYEYETVLSFCSQYQNSVYPIKGQEKAPKSASIKEFHPFKTPLGTVAYGVTVDIYKDRWAISLRRYWDGQSEQPERYFNAPVDLTDRQVYELAAETRKEKINKTTGRVIGYEWYRPQGAANELWDLLVYNSTGLDMMAYDICINQFELEAVEWKQFFQYCEEKKVFFDDNN